jgi:hypothetical protein
MILVIYNEIGYLLWFGLFIMILVIYNVFLVIYNDCLVIYNDSLVIYNDFGYLQWFWLFSMILVSYNVFGFYNDFGYLQWFWLFTMILVIFIGFWLFTMILVIYRKVSHVISIKNSTTDTSHILKESTEFSLINGKFLSYDFNTCGILTMYTCRVKIGALCHKLSLF